jgi:imidazolonepropionase-like amidohydrolase
MNVKIIGHRLIDGTGSAALQRVSIEVTGEKITSVGPAARVRSGAVVRLDSEGITLLPGLIDAHAHLALVQMGQSPAPAAVVAARIFQNCARALDEGFTVVRDLGGADGGLAMAIDGGLVRGPAVLPSGPVLCQSGGHGDFTPCFGLSAHQTIPGLFDPSVCVNGPDAARSATRMAIKRGATQIKVILNGGFFSSTPLQRTFLTRDELEPVVIEATRSGIYVTAHVHSLDALEMAVGAGVGCIEHGTFFGAPGAERLASAAVPLVPTLSSVAMLEEKATEWGIPAHSVLRARDALQANIVSLRQARDRGVLLGLGSDLVGADQRGRAREIVMRAELESPMQALIAATAGNAEVIRRKEDLGKIAPGFRANIIAVLGDPLRDPAVLLDERNIVFVMKDGVVVKNLVDD